MIFSSETIQRFAEDGEEWVARTLRCIRQRISLSITAGVSEYELPSYVLGVSRLLWCGTKLSSTRSASLDFKFADLIGFTADMQGTPQCYFMSDATPRTIKFYPTPSIGIAKATIGLYSSEIPYRVILDIYRTPGTSEDDEDTRLFYWALPWLIKHYVEYKCYSQEGKAQDLELANYHKKQFDEKLRLLQLIYSDMFSFRPKAFMPTSPTLTSRHREFNLPEKYIQE